MTLDINKRLDEHNKGLTTHTNKFKPWKLEAYFAFDSEVIAKRFERYLKSGSGREFARRYFRNV